MADIRTEKQIYQEANIVFVKRLINYFILMIPSILIMLSILDLDAYNSPKVSAVVGVVMVLLIEICVCVIVAKKMRDKYIYASQADICQARFIDMGDANINMNNIFITNLPIIIRNVLLLAFVVFNISGILGFFLKDYMMIGIPAFMWIFIAVYIMFKYYCMRKCPICNLAFMLKKKHEAGEKTEEVWVRVEGVLDRDSDDIKFGERIESTTKRTYKTIYRCKCCGQNYISNRIKYDEVFSDDLVDPKIIEEVDTYRG